MDYVGFAWRTAANRGEPDIFFRKFCVYFFYILGSINKVCRFPTLHYVIKTHSKTFGMLFLPRNVKCGGVLVVANRGEPRRTAANRGEPRRTVFGNLCGEPSGIPSCGGILALGEGFLDPKILRGPPCTSANFVVPKPFWHAAKQGVYGTTRA